jgi:nonsense-mediated mRNA decay protein 3
MNKFCIKCGEEENLVNEFCRDCFKEENSLLKHFKEVKIIICNECGNYLYKNKWLEGKDRELEKNIEKISSKLFEEKMILNDGVKLKSLKINVDVPKKLKVANKNIVNVVLNIDVVGSIKDIEIEEDYEIPSKIEFSTCNNCKKKAGRYFEAKLQIRPRNDKILRFVEEYCEGRSNLFISKVEEDKNGYDVYLSSQREGRSLGNLLKRKFGGEVKESKKLFGRKDGRDVYRATISFRLND